MKLIIAGSRDIQVDSEFIYPWVSDKVTEIVCGMARGIDLCGKQFAEDYDLAVSEWPAEWDIFGKRAGYERNNLMSLHADELLAFWDGKSKGTRHMIQCMIDREKPFQVILIR